jgi:hypothetical protein
MLPAMGGSPGLPAQTSPQTRFSADGFWWWDGSQWRPAMSEDRLWRWTGSTWEPARPGSSGPGSGGTLWIVIAVLVGIVILAGVIAALILYFAGPQISNVFSNLVMSPSSP